MQTETDILKKARANAKEALDHATVRLRAVDEELSRFAALQAEKAQLSGDIAVLGDEVRGLELAIARREGRNTETPRPAPAGWDMLSRADAVPRVLEQAGRPLSPTEITDALHARGRNDSRKGVSVALMRLEQRGVVRKGDRRGLWELVPPSREGGLFREGVIRRATPE